MFSLSIQSKNLELRTFKDKRNRQRSRNIQLCVGFACQSTIFCLPYNALEDR